MLAGVTSLIARAWVGQYWICMEGEAPAGMMMVHYECSVECGGRVHWINSVYVHPEHRRRGVFTRLYNHVMEVARQAGAVAVRLYVETTNQSAVAVYERMGMRNLDKTHVFHERDLELAK